MKRSNLSLILYLSLVFISGLLVGGLGYRLYTTEATAKAIVTENQRPSPEAWRTRYVAAMTERLELSDDQLLQLNAILDEVKVQYEVLESEAHDAFRPQRREIRDQQVARTLKGRERPMLASGDGREILDDLMAVRDPLYREIADLTVETDGRKVKAVASEIMERV